MADDRDDRLRCFSLCELGVSDRGTMKSEEEATFESKTGKNFPRFKDTSCQIENTIASLGRLQNI